MHWEKEGFVSPSPALQMPIWKTYLGLCLPYRPLPAKLSRRARRLLPQPCANTTANLRTTALHSGARTTSPSQHNASCAFTGALVLTVFIERGTATPPAVRHGLTQGDHWEAAALFTRAGSCKWRMDHNYQNINTVRNTAAAASFDLQLALCP